jgi:hypothetical protein
LSSLFWPFCNVLRRNGRASPKSARGQCREWGCPAERVRRTPNNKQFRCSAEDACYHRRCVLAKTFKCPPCWERNYDLAAVDLSEHTPFSIRWRNISDGRAGGWRGYATASATRSLNSRLRGLLPRGSRSAALSTQEGSRSPEDRGASWLITGNGANRHAAAMRPAFFIAWSPV